MTNEREWYEVTTVVYPNGTGHATITGFGNDAEQHKPTNKQLPERDNSGNIRYMRYVDYLYDLDLAENWFHKEHDAESREEKDNAE